MKIPAYPSVADYRERQRIVVYQICAASGRGRDTAPWISEVFTDDDASEDFVFCDEEYTSLDTKLADALRSIVRGE